MSQNNIRERNKLSVVITTVTKLVYLSLLWLLTVQIALAQLPAPPAPGQGSHPPAEIGGDALAAPAVATAHAFNSADSIFPNQSEQIPTTIYLRADVYSRNTHQFMGKRTVWTIRPATLNAMQLDLVSGILQLDLHSTQTNAEHALWLDISTAQLEQLQAVLNSTSHTLNPNNQATFTTQLFRYLPVVKRFARYAVLLGIVFATVLIAFAAYGLIMGQRGSSEKIIGTAAGLIVLLLAFSIYSLLISNTINGSSSDTNLTSSTSSNPPMQSAPAQQR